MLRRFMLLLCGAGMVVPTAAAAVQFVDPVSARVAAYCRGSQDCMMVQRGGIQAFLREITLDPRPSRERVQWCLARATNKKQLTDWTKAARCIR